MSYKSVLAEHRRISILKALVESLGHTNESILQQTLESLGLGALLTRDVVRDDLRFLEGCGAVKLTWVGASLLVAHITVRGVNIANGKEFVEGIKPPALGI